MLQIKYKETYMKDKEKAVGINMSDSKTLHSLQVAKMSSDVSTFFFPIVSIGLDKFPQKKKGKFFT